MMPPSIGATRLFRKYREKTVFKLTVLSILAWPFIVVANPDVEVKTYDASSLKRMRIKNSVGDVEVIAISGEVLKVTLRKEKSESCKIKEKKNPFAYNLSVDEKSKSFFGGSKCVVDLVVSAPSNVTVEVGTSDGDVKVVGFTNEAIIRTGSGDVVLNSGLRNLNIVTGSGDMRVTKASKKSRLHASSGDIKLQMRSIPQKGSLSISVGSGDVELDLPTSAKIRSKIQAGAGGLIDEVGSDLNAEYKLQVRSGTGDVRLKKKF